VLEDLSTFKYFKERGNGTLNSQKVRYITTRNSGKN
jgi:hypothetical protein